MRNVKPHNYSKEIKAMDKEDHYPSISLPLDAIPEAKKWEVGKQYIVTLKLEMTRMSIGGGMMNNDGGDVGFEVYGVEAGKEVKGKVERYQGGEKET